MGLFNNLLKKWFYDNSSSAAASDARVPLLNSDGTPKGSDTMANLASVLGGVYTTLSSAVDFDTLQSNKKYYITGTYISNMINCPVSSGGVILEVSVADGYIYQKIVSVANGGIHVRTAYSSNGNVKVWSSWQQIYDTSLLTNSTMLSSLASALGVGISGESYNSEEEWLAVAVNKAYCFGFIQNLGAHVSFKCLDSPKIFIQFRQVASRLFYRVYNFSSQSGIWKTLTEG